MAMGAIQLRI